MYREGSETGRSQPMKTSHSQSVKELNLSYNDGDAYHIVGPHNCDSLL